VVPLCPEKLPDASSVVKSIMSTVNNSELELKLNEVTVDIDDVTMEVVDSRVDSRVDSCVDSCVVSCTVVVSGLVYVIESPCQVFEPL
jgi:hypothetical protein